MQKPFPAAAISVIQSPNAAPHPQAYHSRPSSGAVLGWFRVSGSAGGPSLPLSAVLAFTALASFHSSLGSCWVSFLGFWSGWLDLGHDSERRHK